MQAPLAVIGFVLGISAWWLTGTIAFVAGGVLMLANWPWTIFGIMPVNELVATKPEEAGPHTRALVVKWNRLHSIRTALGCLAIMAFVIGLL